MPYLITRWGWIKLHHVLKNPRYILHFSCQLFEALWFAGKSEFSFFHVTFIITLHSQYTQAGVWQRRTLCKLWNCKRLNPSKTTRKWPESYPTATKTILCLHSVRSLLLSKKIIYQTGSTKQRYLLYDRMIWRDITSADMSRDRRSHHLYKQWPSRTNLLPVIASCIYKLKITLFHLPVIVKWRFHPRLIGIFHWIEKGETKFNTYNVNRKRERQPIASHG